MADSRRVRMTKKLIKDALLELIEEKPLEKISVADVCRAADVNRSSFYAHYKDLLQLTNEIEQDVLEQLPSASEELYDFSSDYPLRAMADFFDYMQENERLFRILIVRHDSRSFNNRLINTVMERYRFPLRGESELECRYSYTYIINGVVGMLRAWIIDGFPISSASLARLVLDMTVTSLTISGN